MPEKTLKKLGNSIREHRKLKGYSQQELSEITGISRRHIANIENGVANASFEIITILVRELNISLDTIVFTYQSDYQNEIIKSLTIQLSKCNKVQQKIIYKSINCLINEFINLNDTTK